MAGEIILRSEIESNVARYLDRVGDPVITGVTGLWFAQAHRKAQRQFNFSIMESFDNVTPLVEGQSNYICSPLMKEPINGYIVDSNNNEIVSYEKTDSNTWRRHRDDGNYNKAVFTLYGRTYLLNPPTTHVSSGMAFGVNGYMFMPTPAVDGHDWFTDWGSDFLMYQCLLESVDYVSAPEGRLVAWQQRASDALSELIYMDTQFKVSGPMVVR